MPRWIRSDDPIPQGHIRLSEAFGLYYQTVTPNWRELDKAINAATPVNAADAPRRDNKEADAALILAFNARDAARDTADKKFRAALAAGELRAMIRDPDKGTLLELSRNGWNKTSSDDGGFPGAFDEDFVEPGDAFQPGPPAVIHGSLRPVFFNEEEFNNWLLRIVSGGSDTHRKPSGRKRLYDRKHIKELVFERMDYHGDFSDDDPKWK
jgi:hypothetical protein